MCQSGIYIATALQQTHKFERRRTTISSFAVFIKQTGNNDKNTILTVRMECFWPVIFLSFNLKYIFLIHFTVAK